MKKEYIVLLICFVALYFSFPVQAFFTEEDYLKKDSELPKPTATDDDLVQKELVDILSHNDDALKVFDSRLAEYLLVKKFYNERNFQLVWGLHKSTNRKIIRELIKTLEEAYDNGLNPDDYHYSEITKLLDKLNDYGDFARMELLMSDALFKLVQDICNIRVSPKRVHAEWYLPVKKEVAVYPLVAQALEQNTLYRFVSKLYPQTEAYQRLREALIYYRAIEKKGPLPILSGVRKKIVPGDSGPSVYDLRERLRFSGDLHREAQNHIELYDDELKKAVMRYQRLHGLNDDGAVGQFTIDELNRPLAETIKKIRANLEKLRWQSEEELPTKYLYMNIPDSQLFAIENGRVQLQMRTVVGIKTWQTPIFTDEVEYLIINPKWNVPPKILQKEMLPKIQKGHAFLANENYQVRKRENGQFVLVNPNTVDWSQAKPADFQISQKSGRGNALGRIKFIFPNPFDVYLHDTPQKSLFKKDVRTFSHGCIRIERPLELAQYLL
ncbi:MAG TPA: L,D-transpeptidase family protein, partial [bacterium]|nr:L,D-transpeptidase family protein [bacterium]